MTQHLHSKKYHTEYDTFARILKGEKIPIYYLPILFIKSLCSIFEMSIRYIPGGIGYIVRYWYYRLFLKNIGRNVLIDVGVFLNGPANITIGDYTWIDAGCRLEAMLGEISIGKRVHIAPYSILGAREPIIVEDYVGISSGVKIYSNSAYPIPGKRMSGSMIPEEYKAFSSKLIVLKKDSVVGANSVLLPGAELGEGAVVGANSVVSQVVKPFCIVAGFPLRLVGMRENITVPDI